MTTKNRLIASLVVAFLLFALLFVGLNRNNLPPESRPLTEVSHDLGPQVYDLAREMWMLGNDLSGSLIGEVDGPYCSAGILADLEGRLEAIHSRYEQFVSWDRFAVNENLRRLLGARRQRLDYCQADPPGAPQLMGQFRQLSVEIDGSHAACDRTSLGDFDNQFAKLRGRFVQLVIFEFGADNNQPSADDVPVYIQDLLEAERLVIESHQEFLDGCQIPCSDRIICNQNPGDIPGVSGL